MPRSKLSIEDLLATYPDDIVALAEEIRPIIRAEMPEATETAYPGWRAIGYRDPHAGYVCGIFLFDEHVRLIFEHGNLLSDPEGLLEGTAKQTRHLTLKPGEALPEGRVRHFVALAADMGARFRA